MDETPRTDSPPVAPIQPLLISVDKAAETLGIRHTLAWGLVRRGELPSVKVGARRLIPVHELEAYVARLKQAEEASA